MRSSEPRRFLGYVFQDWKANSRDPKARFILSFFRLAQLAQTHGHLGFVVVAAYRVVTEWFLGLELRPKTSVGSGVRLYHAFALVVNDHAVLGRNVTLRHGVTIGHKRPGGGSPTIGDDVEFGAGAMALGDIVIGEGSLIGAGAVVTTDVPPRSLVVPGSAIVTPMKTSSP